MHRVQKVVTLLWCDCGRNTRAAPIVIFSGKISREILHIQDDQM